MRNLKSLTMLAGVLALTCSLSLAGQSDKKSVPPVLDHTVKTLEGKEVDLSKYKDKVLLIVNTASKCGATPQYKDLQALHDKYKDQGLVVLGFPCNQFGAQEPGSAEQISEFCSKNYGVTFDMFSKVDVNGKDADALYQYLTSKKTNSKTAGPVKWNFEKFLISRDGEIAARFRTRVNPQSEEVTTAIETELKKK
ncbi:glutathione peroxidase [Gimesia sp.]|uniref:glutathione peroxidase n=1 Tax=Gimesia sp. TaxID=2024833 RepID=UPI000C430003|nr:glutathione peroxidase [Gimesia sp.]MAX37179.1 glutathione peroxidase [Gimesia sp.]HAH44513.1 glutathione peroxidase [Planctomycetaceae bacterium]HBL41809.1 glutathione peroxidase [Planctomycetaceae bacterium]|tara:strand:- start:14127 stop:14711 length:585 start_codon:yes stop_codon:yes gene_type:complete